MAESRGIQSIEVGYRLLKVLKEAPGPLTLKDLAERAEMSSTKAYYYLTSFMRIGLVAQAGAGGRYDLGPEAIQLGLAAMAHLDILGLAHEAMYDVRDATGEAVFLSVWGNHGPTIVHRVEGTHQSPMAIRVGSVLAPLSATGRALLSTFARPVIEAVVDRAIADAAPTDPWYKGSFASVLPMIEEVWRDGVARGRSTVETASGYIGLAAPITTFEGYAHAALTINGNSSSFNMDQDGPNVRALLGAAKRLSHLAGAT